MINVGSSRIVPFLLAALLLSVPSFALAAKAKVAKKRPVHASAAPFEVSGWIPYWRTATGTADVSAHLDELSEINPFVYTVKADGTLRDNGHLDQDPWKTLIANAQARHIRVIPTVMWANGQAIHDTLSDRAARQEFEDNIVSVVEEDNFDGIDIDFENKFAETKPYFSTFLKGLSTRLGKKWLMCTIESRTPPQDKFEQMPADLEYANDFKKINKYCDRVRFMTYDQDSIDLTLNKQHENELYQPIADPEWVAKAIRVAKQDINPRKIEIGVATYGYEYNVTAYADGYQYSLLWAFNPGYAPQIAALFNATGTRNAAGEMSLTYVPTSTLMVMPSDATTAPNMIPGAASTTTRTIIPTTSQTAAAVLASLQKSGTMPTSNKMADAARTIASSTNSHASFRMLWWSDAQAIADKIALAKRLGVRGVSIFKLDGGEDPNLWSVLQGVKH